MAIPLKQSTASQEVPLGPFVDDADGDTQMTALTIANTDIKIWKNGATTLADKNSGGATHISGGIYYCVLDATDTNTLGPLVIFIHVADALPVKVECSVLPANVYDSMFSTDLLQVDVREFGGTTVTARDIGANVLLSSGTGSGQISLSSGAVLLQATQTGVTIPTVTTVGTVNALANNAVTANAIAANAITADKIATAALPSSKFDATDPVPANIKEINDAAVTGDGTSGTPWDAA